jgi:hypothetical protein
MDFFANDTYYINLAVSGKYKSCNCNYKYY